MQIQRSLQYFILSIFVFLDPVRPIRSQSIPAACEIQNLLVSSLYGYIGNQPQKKTGYILSEASSRQAPRTPLLRWPKTDSTPHHCRIPSLPEVFSHPLKKLLTWTSSRFQIPPMGFSRFFVFCCTQLPAFFFWWVFYLEKYTAWKASIAIATPVSIGLLWPHTNRHHFGSSDRRSPSTFTTVYVWLEKLHVHNLLRIAFSKSHRLQDSSRSPFKQKLHLIYLEDYLFH